jgi:Putative peptidoglycan binding domain
MHFKLTSFLLFTALTAHAQTASDTPPNAQPGKCYAKCLIGAHEVLETKEFAVFMGDDTTDIVQTTLTLEVQKNDQRQRVLLTVVDTETTSEYEMLEMQVYSMHPGGNIEWKEVMCGVKVTPDKIEQIRQALITRGYDAGPPDRVLINPKMKAALVKFQRENQLPEGSLDVETMKLLGVSF